MAEDDTSVEQNHRPAASPPRNPSSYCSPPLSLLSRGGDGLVRAPAAAEEDGGAV
jgi:hypothetical protein